MSTLQVELEATHECDRSGLNEQHAWAFDAAAGNAYGFFPVRFGHKAFLPKSMTIRIPNYKPNAIK